MVALWESSFTSRSLSFFEQVASRFACRRDDALPPRRKRLGQEQHRPPSNKVLSDQTQPTPLILITPIQLGVRSAHPSQWGSCDEALFLARDGGALRPRLSAGEGPNIQIGSTLAQLLWGRSLANSRKRGGRPCRQTRTSPLVDCLVRLPTLPLFRLPRRAFRPNPAMNGTTASRYF